MDYASNVYSRHIEVFRNFLVGISVQVIVLEDRSVAFGFLAVNVSICQPFKLLAVKYHLRRLFILPDDFVLRLRYVFTVVRTLCRVAIIVTTYKSVCSYAAIVSLLPYVLRHFGYRFVLAFVYHEPDPTGKERDDQQDNNELISFV